MGVDKNNGGVFGQGERHAILASLTGSKAPELKLSRGCQTGEEEMFHVEHFDPRWCSIWNIVQGVPRRALVCVPGGGWKSSQSCAPHGTLQLECSTWNIYVNWDGLGSLLGNRPRNSSYVPLPGTCPGEAKRSVFHVEHYSILAIPKGSARGEEGSF